MPCTQADYCKQYDKDIEKCMKDDKCYFYRMKSDSDDDKDKKPKAPRCPIVLDARTQKMWDDEGHASCAHRLQVQFNASLVSKVLSLAKGDRNYPVQVYCGAGIWAAQAVKVLKDLGWSNVTNAGGWNSGQVESIKKLCDCKDKKPGYGDDDKDKKPGYGDDDKDKKPGYGDDDKDKKPGYGDDDKDKKPGYGDDDKEYKRGPGCYAKKARSGRRLHSHGGANHTKKDHDDDGS